MKESYYRTVFNTKFNLSFKPPKTDTCTVCDQFDAKLSVVTDVAEKQELEKQKKDHKDSANEGQNLMKTLAANTDPETSHLS